MRRDRWMIEWFCYALAAGFVMALVLMAMAMISASQLQRQLDELQHELDSRVAEPATGGAEVPTPVAPVSLGRYGFPIHPEDFGRLTSPFGIRDDPLAENTGGGENVKDHGGLDMIATVWRARVRPIAAGEVTIHWPPKGRPVPGHPGWTYKGDPERGAWIEILHDDGWRSRYLHLAWTNPAVVQEGRRVETDDILGRVGGSGRTTGSHLHLELIRPDGERVNPLLFLEQP